tara:strand:- start:90 stop:281 length:192 start_codon:yes stop_codon:yes gene_type:complete
MDAAELTRIYPWLDHLMAAKNQAIQSVTRDPQHANFVQRVGFMQEMRDGTATYTRVGGEQPPT